MLDYEDMAEGYLIEPDFLLELKANGLSDMALKNYLTAVESLDVLDKDPRDMDRKDLIRWSAGLEDRYAESTIRGYKAYVKKYFRWLKTGRLNDGQYPECVEWMKTGGKRKKLPKEILSYEEIEKMAKVAEKQRDRTMVWVGYESGARPGELLGLKIRDVQFDQHGAKIMVDGKTGERRIRVVESADELKEWLKVHPRGKDPDAALCWSQKGGSLARQSWSRTLKKLASKAGIKKRIHPHLLRHSRATHVAGEGLNEVHLRKIFGWTRNSDMPSIYVHLSGRDTDRAILELYD